MNDEKTRNNAAGNLNTMWLFIDKDTNGCLNKFTWAYAAFMNGSVRPWDAR